MQIFGVLCVQLHYLTAALSRYFRRCPARMKEIITAYFSLFVDFHVLCYQPSCDNCLELFSISY